MDPSLQAFPEDKKPEKQNFIEAWPTGRHAISWRMKALAGALPSSPHGQNNAGHQMSYQRFHVSLRLSLSLSIAFGGRRASLRTRPQQRVTKKMVGLFTTEATTKIKHFRWGGLTQMEAHVLGQR